MIPEYESKLDDVFTTAFETNHPAMLDYVQMKMELKRLRNMDYSQSDGERYRTALEEMRKIVKRDYHRSELVRQFNPIIETALEGK
jgi:urate oxidase